MTKIGPGPPSPISGPRECPIWAQAPNKYMKQKFYYFIHSIHLILGAKDNWTYGLGLFVPFFHSGPQNAQFGPKRLASIWSRNSLIGSRSAVGRRQPIEDNFDFFVPLAFVCHQFFSSSCFFLLFPSSFFSSRFSFLFLPSFFLHLCDTLENITIFYII